MSTSIVPPKLRKGDEIRILAISRSLGGLKEYPGITEADIAFARERLESLDLRVTFGRHVMDCNAHLTAPIQKRLDDLHVAFADASVKAILAVSGGAGAIQLLDGIDYDLIARNPKIVCGYSDVAYPANAIHARTGLVTYYGPNFGTFMMHKGFEYIERSFRACLFDDAPMSLRPAERWSDDNWIKDQANRTFLPGEGFWAIQVGKAQGFPIASAGFVLNLLQGSSYFPPLKDAILFLEMPSEGKASLMALDTILRGLALQPQFKGVRGIVIGRFARNARINRESLTALVRDIPSLVKIPVAANVDFGHTVPMATLPIGGHCQLRVGDDRVEIKITQH